VSAEGPVGSGPGRPSGSSSTTAAGILILALTALFAVLGVDQVRGALDADQIDRETLLTAIGLGLNPGQLRTFLAITSAVVLGLCVLTTILGIGVLRRREGVRHAAIGTFVVFAAITIPLAVSGLLAEDPSPGVLIGLTVGVADAGVVVFLLRRDTSIDFERAEQARARARAERRRRRRSRQAERSPSP
jgi:hypothetical protein